MNGRPEDLAEWFFLGNAESYDHIARVSTLGLDGWWKRKILKKIPKNSRPNPRAGQWDRYSDLQNRAALSQVPHYRCGTP